MVSFPGIGEAALSVASGFNRNMIFTVRKVGSVTSALGAANEVGIRGPYGTSWPWKKYDQIVAVAGGIGIPPIRSLIEEIDDFGQEKELEVFYGARTPSDIVYKKEIRDWSKRKNFHLTVDKKDDNWSGDVGFVTSIMEDSKLSKDAAVFIIGPPLMMKNAVKEARRIGYGEDNIFLSLERRMECGIGTCGHCNIGEFYACEDGPIFKYSSVKYQNELFL